MINYFDRNTPINTNQVTYVKEHIIIRSGINYENLGNAVADELTVLTEMGPSQLLRSRLVLKSESSVTFQDNLFQGIDCLMKMLDAGISLEIQADYLIDNNSDFPDDVRTYVSGYKPDPESFFYGFYTTLPDTEEDPEMMIAYGTMNGKTYHGLLPFAAASVPGDHVWSCAWPGVICETKNVDAAMRRQLEELADSLSRFSRNNQMESKNGSFYFQMDAAELHSDREICAFLSQAQKMQDLTDQIPQASCCYMTSFTDITGTDPVSMHAEFSPDGSYRMKYTEI